MRMLNKKKIGIIGVFIVLFVVILIVVYISSRDNELKIDDLIENHGIIEKIYEADKYTVKFTSVDDYSPDFKAEIYENKKKIEFEQIKTDDNIILCTSKNPQFSNLDIIDVAEITIVLKDGGEFKVEIKEW